MVGKAGASKIPVIARRPINNVAEALVANGTLEALPTFFEQVTAIALVAFREAAVDLAILETGLGGRLDSTTAAKAAFCAITTIDFDHEEYLGHTIEEIASEKAAIIHRGSEVVIGPQIPEAHEVILRRCVEVGVTPRPDYLKTTINDVSTDGRFLVSFEIFCGRLEKIWLGLRGRHQIDNAGVALQLAELLTANGFLVSSQAMAEGLQTAVHPGRLELIKFEPAILLDGAHNPEGTRALRNYLQRFGLKPLTIVFGAMRDKRLDSIAEVLFPIADKLILTEVRNARSASLETLVALARQFSTAHVETAATSDEALKIAREQTPLPGMICVTGSLYLIGEVRGKIISGKNHDE